MTDAKPSKSAKKREYLALQALGEQLILLRVKQLTRIDTDAELIEQVLRAKKISSHSALRRQKQLIGKIMREVDPEPIRAALARIGQGDLVAKSVFKQSEQWRDRIAAEGKLALQEFFTSTGQHSDVLAAQVRDHSSMPDGDRRLHIQRKMFKEIHRVLVAQHQHNGS